MLKRPLDAEPPTGSVCHRAICGHRSKPVVEFHCADSETMYTPVFQDGSQWRVPYIAESRIHEKCDANIHPFVMQGFKTPAHELKGGDAERMLKPALDFNDTGGLIDPNEFHEELEESEDPKQTNLGFGAGEFF